MHTLPTWTAGLHHDGSALYVSNPWPRLGQEVTLTLRTPRHAPLLHVLLRSTPDGEPHHARMELARQDAVSDCWQASFKVSMTPYNYHFKLISQDGTFFYTAQGVSAAQKPDYYDFKLLADFAAPTWVQSAIFYQIFPDRFHNGDPSLTPQEGAWSQEGKSVHIRQWGEPPMNWQQSRSLEFFGGDLVGIEQKLDYLQNLGVTALYLTPIFLSQTNHRYDILDFHQVDPHLGGNAALVSLRQALHERGMHLMLDITPNHLSWHHPWFTAAQADPQAQTAEFFTFYNEERTHYEAWLGVPTLVKINYASQRARDWMYRNPDSALRYWLHEPYRIDGWRLDVLNMTARQGQHQLHHEVGREIRQAVKGDHPQAYLIGEHFFDGTHHAQGDQMDAVMNYQGFNLPVYRWLSPHHGDENWQLFGGNIDPSQLSSAGLAEQLQTHLGAVPYGVALQQFNQLGSHDIIRFVTRVGSRAKLKIALAMLMTYPGVPCLYYGDEIGMEGGADPDNRRCMVWDESAWDQELLAYTRAWIALRKQHSALQTGGIEWLYAEGDVIAYQRHSAQERLIIVAHRGQTALEGFHLPLAQAGWTDGTLIQQWPSQESLTVQNGLLTLPNLPAESVWLGLSQLSE